MAFPNVAPPSQGGGLQAGRKVTPVEGGSVTFEWTVAAPGRADVRGATTAPVGARGPAFPPPAPRDSDAGAR